MAFKNKLRDIQSNTLGIIPSEGQEGSGFIVYDSTSSGSFVKRIEGSKVCLVDTRAIHRLKTNHEFSSRICSEIRLTGASSPFDFDILSRFIDAADQSLSALRSSRRSEGLAIIEYEGGAFALPIHMLLEFLNDLHEKEESKEENESSDYKEKVVPPSSPPLAVPSSPRGCLLSFGIVLLWVAGISIAGLIIHFRLSSPPPPAPTPPVAVIERIEPVARVTLAVPQPADAELDLSGQEVYNKVCMACHVTGAAGAPKVGAKDQWEPRFAQGLDTLVKNAVNGIRGMPPKGGNPALSEVNLKDAIVYMLGETGIKVPSPAPLLPAPAAPPPAAVAPVEPEMVKPAAPVAPPPAPKDVARAVEPLIAALRDKDDKVRRAVAEALGMLGDARAVEPLIAALGDKDKDTREAAAESLGKIKPDWPASDQARQQVRLFIAYLKNPEWSDRHRPPYSLSDVSVAAADALGKIGDARAVKPLIAALGDKHKEVRGAAAAALRKIKPDWPASDEARQQVLEFIAALKDSDWRVRQATADVLGKIGDARAVEPLIAALRDKDEVHDAAAAALGKIKPDWLASSEAGQQVPALVAALRNKDNLVRQRAADALGKIGDARAVEPLIATLRDKDKNVHHIAADALGKLGDARAVEPLIATLKDSDWITRKRAADALEKIKPDWPASDEARRQGQALFIAALHDKDGNVREAAADALEKIALTKIRTIPKENLCSESPVKYITVGTLTKKKVFPCVENPQVLGLLDQAGLLATDPSEIWFILEKRQVNNDLHLQCTGKFVDKPTFTQTTFTYSYPGQWKEVFSLKDVHSGKVVASKIFLSTAPECVFHECTLNTISYTARCSGGEARSTYNEAVLVQWLKAELK